MPEQQQPNNAESLAQLRVAIDQIDRQILGLLNLRTGLILKVGEVKKQSGLNVHMPQREEEILRRLGMSNPGPLQSRHLRAIYREIFAASRELQAEIKGGVEDDRGDGPLPPRPGPPSPTRG